MKNFGTISKSFHRPYNGLYGISGTFPLAGINDLSATESGGTVSLTWTDPDDVVKGGKTVTSWTSTKIIRKEGSAPTDSTDGDLILTETTKNQYSSSGYVDSTITVSGTYYYAAFAVADNGLETISNVETVVIVLYKTYTITREEKSNMSSGRVYSDDATGMTAGSTDFDEFFGYSAVLLDENGNEVEEVKQSSPGTLNMNSFQGALTGTANNVMIKFPRRGVKMSKDGNFVTLSITNEPNKAGFQYYAFTKGTTAKDYLYLGAFKASAVWKSSHDGSYSLAGSFSGADTYLKSRATLTAANKISPIGNVNLTPLRTSAQKNGSNYGLITLYPRRYVMCLYMMKYGNPNSQNVVGAGYVNGSSTVAPGGTVEQTSATYGGVGQNRQIKLFGLEDFWGNIDEFIDCAFISSSGLTVDKTNSIFQESAHSTILGTVPEGRIAKIDGSNDGMFRNTSTSGGSSSAYYGDGTYPGNNRNVLYGGHYNSGSYAGIFIMNSYAAGGDLAFNYYGARLQYL